MTPRVVRPLLRACGAVAALALLAPAVRGQGEPLPAAADLVARSVNAMGGAAAMKQITSIHRVGTAELAAQQIKGTVEVFTARPNKAYIRLTLPIGKIENGFDGKVGWEIDPTSGPALVTGRRLAEMADDAWFEAELHGPEIVASMTTVARTEFDGRPAYQVKVVMKSGAEQTEYFDAETSLGLGFEARRESGMGVLPTTVIARDFRKVGALLQPMTNVVRTMGFEQVLHFTSVEYNTVPPSTFDLPPQIRALIKK